jgi:hypothetical protein
VGYRFRLGAQRKQLPGVRCYHGDAQAGEFFAELDALINVLPLTEQTAVFSPGRCSSSFPQARC